MKPAKPRKGGDPLPWVRLWRVEEGSFAQLPLLARALHAEMLKLADADGCIATGHKVAHDAVAFALGADRADRRALRKYIPMLVNEGCLIEEPGRLRFSGWAKRQMSKFDLDQDSNGSRTGHEETPIEPRSDPDPVTNGSRTGHEDQPKSPESLYPDRQTRPDADQTQTETRPPPGVRGGEPLALVSPVGTLPRKRSKKPPEVGPSAATWAAYAEAHEARYGVPPVRNARVNAQVAQVVSRLGAEEAPEVARWFVTHNAGWYVTKGHPIGALLADAEKLRTEWATGRRITRGDAREAETLDEFAAKSARVKALMEGMKR